MPADSVNNTSFKPATDGFGYNKKPADKTEATTKSCLVRETDLNTIQGYIVKQEYPISRQKPSRIHSFSNPPHKRLFLAPENLVFFHMNIPNRLNNYLLAG